MSSIIQVKEATPGASAANGIMAKLRQIGIQDVQLFYDKDIQPYGMWAVVQVQKRSSSLIMPAHYYENNIQPYILWWCKDNNGRFRVPSDQDLNDILAVVTRAKKTWEEGGDKLADKLDAQDAAKDEAHRQKQRDMVHEIAPAVKKAIKKGRF